MLLRCSILNKKPKRDLQVKLSSPLCTPRETGLQQLQGAEKRVGSSWWVTGEELVGSWWWKMLWKVLGVFQGQCLDPAQNLGAVPGALPCPGVEPELWRGLQRGKPNPATTKNGPGALHPWISSGEPGCINEAFQELSPSLSLALTASNTGVGKTTWFTLRHRYSRTFLFS